MHNGSDHKQKPALFSRFTWERSAVFLLWSKENRCNGSDAAALPDFNFREKRKDVSANVAKLATLHVSLRSHKSCSLYKPIVTHTP